MVFVFVFFNFVMLLNENHQLVYLAKFVNIQNKKVEKLEAHFHILAIVVTFGDFEIKH